LTIQNTKDKDLLQKAASKNLQQAICNFCFLQAAGFVVNMPDTGTDFCFIKLCANNKPKFC
jgi:hypothetical protein